MSEPAPGITVGPLPPRHAEAGFDEDPLRVLQEGHRRHGPVFRMPVDGVDTVLVGTWRGLGDLFGAERGRLEVLNTPLVHDLFGRALFNLTGDGHGQARRLLRPALSGRALHAYVPALLEVTAPVAARWAQSGGLDLYGSARSATGAMSARVLLGIAPGSAEGAAFAGYFERFVAATGATGPRRRASGRYWTGRVARRRLHALFARQAAAAGRDGEGSVLARLVPAFEGAPKAAGPLEDHLLALLIAARETTASLVTWCLVELAGNRDQAVLAAADACRALGEPGLLLDREELPVLRAVLAETLRLHAPNLLSMREAVCPVTLGGHHVPAGERVAYSPSAGHFDPAVFPEPGVFRPERFLGGEVSASRLWAFGGGAHACLGRPLAELMALAIVMSVLGQGLPYLPDGPPTRIRHRPAKAPVNPLPFTLVRQESGS
ncbi:cytochrome P450 [Streptomyces goshikiensis]|uniref:cytochrome P450 n=1 Tax=Streptomyces goshikiensis TaxID=1942 RepID=UPI0036464545